MRLHSTSLTKRRQRVGAERLAVLLAETVAIAVSDRHVTKRELPQVIVDTTVQEKNITCPTDSKLYEFGQKVSVTTTNRCNWIVGVNTANALEPIDYAATVRDNAGTNISSGTP